MPDRFIKYLSLFFTFICVYSCNSKPENPLGSEDSISLVLRYSQELHTKSHDTTISVHSDSSMMVILSEMNKDLKNIFKTYDIDRDFVEILKTFRMAELELAYIELALGRDTLTKMLAMEIKNREENEVEKLTSFLEEHKDSLENTKSFYKEIAIHLNKREVVTYNNPRMVDKQFSFFISKHHNNAIQFIKTYLKFETREPLKKFANELVKRYKNDLRFLKIAVATEPTDL